MTLPTELFAHQKEIEGFSRDFGLDFYPVEFELVDFRMMNQLAAYDGFPVRYPHWRFGMEYERLSKSYAYGLHRIYEMVINNNPCYAYLMTSNKLVDQKLVIAHVYGHCDFFKNNAWFVQTNRRMLDEMANHAARMRRYISQVGLESVENFLDRALSLENLIDIHAPAIRRQAALNRVQDDQRSVPRIQANEYMDPYINPPEYLAEQQRKLEEAIKNNRRFPAEPARDVLLFLLEYAPLENWQRNILDIVREEALYFAPQKQTKIMNEGWASFVHSQLMTNQILQPSELIDYADQHAGTLATQPGQLNPYKLGMELYRDIEDRWDRGAFGPEYEQNDDLLARRNWDRQLGLGRQKLFEVRRIYNDVGFIETFLTEDFARRHNLFTFAYNDKKDDYEIAGRDFQEIKRRLLFQLTNFGQPIIEVMDGNFENRGELLLEHRHEGIDLDIPYAQATLGNIYAIWTRPVHLYTYLKDKGLVMFSIDHDGLELHEITAA